MLVNTQFGGKLSIKHIDDLCFCHRLKLSFRDEAQCSLRNSGQEDGLGAAGGALAVMAANERPFLPLMTVHGTHDCLGNIKLCSLAA